MLSFSHRAVLEAVARRVVPHAYDGTGTAVDLVAHIEARLAKAPPERARDLELALTILGSRAAGLLLSGMTAPFPHLSADRQDRLLRRWSTSPLMVGRTVYQGVRRLVLAVYYTTPESFEETGYLGPLHLRTPLYAWEGPLAHAPVPNADEPVARGDAVSIASEDALPSDAARASAASRAISADAARATADVIVIGSGAGGAVAAARLAELGRDVLLLEEGNLVGADELTEREDDMTARLYAESGMRATDDLSFVLLQGAAVGGGTLVNWMITFRAPDFVLDEWADRFGITGFSPAEMAPMFDRVEREIHAVPVPDDAHSPANRILLDGARRLGWRAGTAHQRARMRSCRILRSGLPLRREAERGSRVRSPGARGRRATPPRCAGGPHRGDRARWQRHCRRARRSPDDGPAQARSHHAARSPNADSARDTGRRSARRDARGGSRWHASNPATLGLGWRQRGSISSAASDHRRGWRVA